MQQKDLKFFFSVKQNFVGRFCVEDLLMKLPCLGDDCWAKVQGLENPPLQGHPGRLELVQGRISGLMSHAVCGCGGAVCYLWQ